VTTPGKGTGKIIEVYHSKARKVIKGSEITRNASKSNPAYLIEQKNGSLVLKLHSEIDSSK